MENNENLNVATPQEESYSPIRYGLGAILAFFGFSSKTHRASKKRAKLVGDIFTYAVLLFGSFLMVYPFRWKVAGSFALTNITGTGNAILNRMVWWPSISTFNTELNAAGGFRNYAEVFNRAFPRIAKGFTFWRALGNNLLYSIVPVVIGVITSASAAFSFAKIQIGRAHV